ncbi:response regulator [Paenibacillus sp. PL2-23]|uniref:response regulator n=1 Tax=Paenibacillus sp. PL2-23 TaxID=2100729 RepID=UPI0030F64130
MRILVVDDERTIREGLKRTINKEFADSVQVSTASLASEALQLLMTERIHVVFLDIMMPGMNGLELLAEARKKHRGVHWIVVSAHSEFKYAQEALRLGAEDYILKPFGKEQIIKSVASLLEAWRQQEQAPIDASIMEQNLNYLREAVFRRWIQGLDIGCFDMSLICSEYQRFHLVAVKLESHKELSLRNFIVENVMSEYIQLNGKGFLVNMDDDFLVGVVTLLGDGGVDAFQSGAIQQLDLCLREPYQLYMSAELTDFYAIPSEIRKFHSSMTAFSDQEQEEVDHASGKGDAIDIALQYIKGQYYENLTLERVASIVYLNPVYFSKLFKLKTGTGYKEYLTHLRMDKAAELLRHPDMTITRIAELVGYPDVRHFTQVFRKHFECTPSQFRVEKAHV